MTVAIDALRSAVAAVPFLTFLDVDVDAGPDGRPAMVLRAGERHMGDPRARSVHGGVLAGFVETAAVIHVRLATPGAAVATVDFTTEFLRAAELVPTTATVTVVRQGRSRAHVQVEAHQHAGERLVAVGYGNIAIDAPPAGGGAR